MAAFFRTVYTHKYKATAFTAVWFYATDTIAFTLRKKREREIHLRQAKLIGNEPLSVHSHPRRLTIIINPKSNGGKAQPTFNDDVAPILHFAGVDYGIVETTHPGHAKELMETMDLGLTDGIVVCGGGGLLHEVVTGLMRRQDADTATRTPLGLIPLGATNKTSMQLIGEERYHTPTYYRTKAALAVVQAKKSEAVDVAAVSSEQGTVYSLDSVRFGAASVWQDATASTPWPITSLFPDTYAIIMSLFASFSFPVSLSGVSSVDGNAVYDGDCVDLAINVGGKSTPGRARCRVVKSASGPIESLRVAWENPNEMDDNATETAVRFVVESGSLTFKNKAGEEEGRKLLIDGEPLPCVANSFEVLPSQIKIYV